MGCLRPVCSPPTAGNPGCGAARPPDGRRSGMRSCTFPGHRPGEAPQPGSLLQDGRLQRTCLSPQYITRVSLYFLFAEAASWTPAGCGGRGRPSLGARLHWEHGQPAATPRAMAICPGREGAARRGGEDRSGPAVLVLGGGAPLCPAKVQPRCEFRTIWWGLTPAECASWHQTRGVRPQLLTVMPGRGGRGQTQG